MVTVFARRFASFRPETNEYKHTSRNQQWVDCECLLLVGIGGVHLYQPLVVLSQRPLCVLILKVYTLGHDE